MTSPVAKMLTQSVWWLLQPPRNGTAPRCELPLNFVEALLPWPLERRLSDWRCGRRAERELRRRRRTAGFSPDPRGASMTTLATEAEFAAAPVGSAVQEYATYCHYLRKRKDGLWYSCCFGIRYTSAELARNAVEPMSLLTKAERKRMGSLHGVPAPGSAVPL